MEEFERSKLWKATLALRDDDDTDKARQKLRQSYLDFRTRVGDVLKQIATDAPDLTVHDLTHVDALWEISDLLIGPAVTAFTPTETYLLGGAFLLHDAALSVVAFKGDLSELQSTPEWTDGVIASLLSKETPVSAELLKSPPPEVLREALLGTLRLYHARKAEELPRMAWAKPGSGEQLWLIQDEELRNYYGPVIGLLAKSHWSDTWRLSNDLPPLVTPGPGMPTEWVASPLKLACLLRVADAAHLDHRRAPSVLMALHRPSPGSLKYWTFQNKVGKPGLQDEAIVYSSGAFGVDDTDAWWECLDVLRSLDLELKRVDSVLQDRNLPRLRVRRVAGVDSPENMRKFILTEGWTPVDAGVKVSDVHRIVEMFGGRKLYGDDLMISVRELVQNAADAIRAKDLLRGLSPSFGVVQVHLHERDGYWWLEVIDNGIGMSARVLTQVLLDFGERFWTGSLVREELPGLLSKGMRARGTFGIGFFSVFMLGDRVRITTWKDGTAAQDSCTLEFRGGLGSRPILRQPTPSESLAEPGTRVSVCLRTAPTKPGGLLWGGKDWQGKPIHRDLGAALARMAPVLDTSIDVVVSGDKRSVIKSRDWTDIDDNSLLARITEGSFQTAIPVLRTLRDAEGKIYGRAALDWELHSFREKGIVTIDGIRASSINHLIGVLVGETSETLARDAAFPTVPFSVLSQWATEQTELFLELAKTHRLDPYTSNERALMRIASLVLKCGGDPGELPFVSFGVNSLSAKSFGDRLRSLEEFYLFSGDIEYDEDLDNVHPRDFKDNFVYSPELIRVTDESPILLRIGAKVWPDYLFEDDAGRPRTLADLLWKVVQATWVNFDCEEEEEYEVGEVNGTPIRREVKQVARAATSQG